MKTQGRPCFYSSFIPRSLRTQKQMTSSRGNLNVESVTRERCAAIHKFASKHTFKGRKLVPFPFLFPFLCKTFLHLFFQANGRYALF